MFAFRKEEKRRKKAHAPKPYSRGRGAKNQKRVLNVKKLVQSHIVASFVESNWKTWHSSWMYPSLYIQLVRGYVFRTWYGDIKKKITRSFEVHSSSNNFCRTAFCCPDSPCARSSRCATRFHLGEKNSPFLSMSHSTVHYAPQFASTCTARAAIHPKFIILNLYACLEVNLFFS